MIKTIIGLVLLLFPLFLISRFKNKKLGFAYVLSLFFAFYLAGGILLLFFGVFNYPVVILINAGVCLFVFRSVDFRGLFKKSNLKKIDWVLILVLVISFISLYSVHYNYTGEYSRTLISNYEQAQNMKYPYPYFSDEWYAVSFIQHFIDTGSQLTRNTLVRGNPFSLNLEFVFHSLIAGIIVLMGLNPLMHYTFISIFFNLIIILIIYLFLRFSNISKLASAVASLSALYITNGTNLPGLWNLIPFSIGIILVLLGFFFIQTNNKKMILLISVLLLFYYFPLLLFYLVAVLLYGLFNNQNNKNVFMIERIKKIFLYILVLTLSLFVAVFILGILFYISYLSRFSSFPTGAFFMNLGKIFISKISYVSLAGSFIPKFSIFSIIPWPVLVLFFAGVYPVFKSQNSTRLFDKWLSRDYHSQNSGDVQESRLRHYMPPVCDRGFLTKRKWLFGTVFFGLILWGLYSLSTDRMIISYPRVVVFTSILIALISGFGLEHLAKKMKKLDFFKKYKILEIILVLALILLFVSPLAGYYTSRDNWKSLKFCDKDDDTICFNPAAPANKYLQEDDLVLFKNIHNRTFLSAAWKGTVIGVATDNYPVSIKPGNLILRPGFRTGEFVNADCAEKKEIVEKYNIEYVYLAEFNCDYLEFIGRSNEGFYLYKTHLVSLNEGK